MDPFQTITFLTLLLVAALLTGCDSSVAPEEDSVPDPVVELPTPERARDSIHITETSVRTHRSTDTWVSSSGVISLKHWGPDIYVNHTVERAVQDSLLALIGGFEDLSPFLTRCRQDRYYLLRRTIYATGEKRKRYFQPCIANPSHASILEGLALLDSLAQQTIITGAPWTGVTQEAELLNPSVARTDSLHFAVRLINHTDLPRQVIFQKESIIELSTESAGYDDVEWGFGYCWHFVVHCVDRTVDVAPRETVQLNVSVPIALFLIPGVTTSRPLVLEYVPSGIGYSGPILTNTVQVDD